MSATDEVCQDPCRYLDAFPEDKWSGPSVYFHCKALSRLKELQSKPSAAVCDLQYLEYLYATLTAWGLHRMGRESGKLVDFDRFRQQLVTIGLKVDQLSTRSIDALEPKEEADITNCLKDIVEQLRLRPTDKPSVVVATKTLHHLLPNLVVPIDRKYTFNFFGRSETSDDKNPGKFFSEAYADFVHIANCIKPFAPLYLGRGFHTNLPKMVDNAIVGWVLDKEKTGPIRTGGSPSEGLATMPDATVTKGHRKEDYIQAIVRKFREGTNRGEGYIDIRAGDIHNKRGGPNRMPTCCSAMEALKRAGDKYLYQPPKGKGPNLKIRYRLPR